MYDNRSFERGSVLFERGSVLFERGSVPFERATTSLSLPFLTPFLHPTLYSPSSSSFPQIFEDAQDSPLEQRISDSIVATKDNKDNGIFSLVPSRVATFSSPPQPSSSSQTDAICNPDSFSELFRLLGEWGEGRRGCWVTGGGGGRGGGHTEIQDRRVWTLDCRGGKASCSPL